MKSILAICTAGIALVLSAVAEEAPKTIVITLDPEADFVRDLRESTAAPVLGYAGSMIEYPDSMLQWFFVTNRAETAQMMKAAGARHGPLRDRRNEAHGDWLRLRLQQVHHGLL